MDMQLSGKKALITGSTYGIGYAIAEALVKEGADVIITGRHQESVDTAIGKLKRINSKTKPTGISADCATIVGCQKVFDAEPEVDILINNLGIYERKTFFEIEDSDWTHFFEVNVMSGVRFARFYIPKMVTKEWGRVIFVSSESGLMIPPEMIHYGFSKSAQLSISRGLAMSLSGTGVTVNALLPGPTRTDTTSTPHSLSSTASTDVPRIHRIACFLASATLLSPSPWSPPQAHHAPSTSWRAPMQPIMRPPHAI